MYVLYDDVVCARFVAFAASPKNHPDCSTGFHGVKQVRGWQRMYRPIGQWATHCPNAREGVGGRKRDLCSSANLDSGCLPCLLCSWVVLSIARNYNRHCAAVGGISIWPAPASRSHKMRNCHKQNESLGYGCCRQPAAMRIVVGVGRVA